MRSEWFVPHTPEWGGVGFFDKTSRFATGLEAFFDMAVNPKWNPGAGRNRRERPSDRPKLILFAQYLVQGMKPFDAYSVAGLIEEEDCRNALETPEIQILTGRADSLAKDPRVKQLVKLLRTDAKQNIRTHLTALTMLNVFKAFNSLKDRDRAKVSSDLMGRGGLPAESVQYAGSLDELQKLTDEQLRAELVKAVNQLDGKPN